MCSMVDHYLLVFAGLKSERRPISWPIATNFRSPGKPLLIMAVLDLIAHRRLHMNFIEPTSELVQRFQAYQRLLPAEIGTVNVAEPFIGLEAESFWHLRLRGGKDLGDPEAITTVEQLRECYFGATFSDDLFPLLQMQSSREKLCQVLLESYFSLVLQHRLKDYSAQSFTATEQS